MLCLGRRNDHRCLRVVGLPVPRLSGTTIVNESAALRAALVHEIGRHTAFGTSGLALSRPSPRFTGIHPMTDLFDPLDHLTIDPLGQLPAPGSRRVPLVERQRMRTALRHTVKRGLAKCFRATPLGPLRPRLALIAVGWDFLHINQPDQPARWERTLTLACGLLNANIETRDDREGLEVDAVFQSPTSLRKAVRPRLTTQPQNRRDPYISARDFRLVTEAALTEGVIHALDVRRAPERGFVATVMCESQPVRHTDARLHAAVCEALRADLHVPLAQAA